MSSRADSAVYLYCVVRAATAPLTRSARVPPGVPGASVAAVHRIAASLWIVAATVPLDTYGPAHLEPRLRDLDWVSEVAVAHEQVVERFTRVKGATVIPMKLFTLFSSLERATADVASRRAQLQAAARRIAGAEEWGVRVFRRPDPQPAKGKRGRAASGTDFLRGRQQAREAVAMARSAAADAADAAFGKLRRLARDARVREARPEPGTHPPILDAAFLVAAGARARFHSEAKRQAGALRSVGAELVVSGPWPAYNFVSTEDRA